MRIQRGHTVRFVLATVTVAVAVTGCAPGTGSSPPPAAVSSASAPQAASPVPPGTGGPGYVAAGAGSTVVTHGPTDRHAVALTFDSNMTDAMLRRLDVHEVDSYANTAVIDELEARHVPATFFLAGKWVERYPDLTRRIAADPDFELASHSYAHRGFTSRCYGLEPEPSADMAHDVERSFAVLTPFGGHQTRYFRFPGGCYDAAALRAVAPTHATVVQYDDVGDDPFNRDAAGIAARVLRQAHDGAIVVLHITKANAPRTADALPSVIDGLRARGYRLVTLSDLLGAP